MPKKHPATTNTGGRADGWDRVDSPPPRRRGLGESDTFVSRRGSGPRAAEKNFFRSLRGGTTVHCFGPVAWCLFAAALFGFSTPISKPLALAMGPPLLAGLLYGGAALLTGPRALRRGGFRQASGKNWLLLAGAAFLGGMVGPVLLLTGLLLAPAGAVSLWLTLETAATAVLAHLLFNEHLGRNGWLAVALVCAGSALLSTELSANLAAGLVALACVCWGLDNNWTSLIDDFTPEQTTFVKGITTALTLVPLGLALGGRATLPQVGVALAIGGLSYGLSLIFYVAGAQQLGAVRSQLVFSSAPLFGLVAAVFLLGEPLTQAHAAALALIALGLWLSTRTLHDHQHIHEPTTHTHFHRHDDGHHAHAHGIKEPRAVLGWHSHRHHHARQDHSHPHRPDLHHRHLHQPSSQPAQGG